MMKTVLNVVMVLCVSLTAGCKTASHAGAEDASTAKSIAGSLVSDVKYDDLTSALVTKANLRKLSGLDAYTADYRLFTPGIFASAKNGEAKSIFKNTFYSVENDGLDRATKNLIIHDSSNGDAPFVEYNFAVIEYASQGVSRGQFVTHAKIFKGDDGKVNVITDVEAFRNAYRPNSTPVSLTMNASQIVLTYNQSQSGSFQPGTYQLVIKLNDTLDSTLSVKNGSAYQEVAHFNGGKKVQPGDMK